MPHIIHSAATDFSCTSIFIPYCCENTFSVCWSGFYNILVKLILFYCLYGFFLYKLNLTFTIIHFVPVTELFKRKILIFFDIDLFIYKQTNVEVGAVRAKKKNQPSNIISLNQGITQFSNNIFSSSAGKKNTHTHINHMFHLFLREHKCVVVLGTTVTVGRQMP